MAPDENGRKVVKPSPASSKSTTLSGPSKASSPKPVKTSTASTNASNSAAALKDKPAATSPKPATSFPTASSASPTSTSASPTAKPPVKKPGTISQAPAAKAKALSKAPTPAAKGKPKGAAAVKPAGPAPDELKESAVSIEDRLQQLLSDASAQAELEALRTAAWKAQVAADKRKAALQAERRAEEARRKKEEAAVRKALLEAAFDGETEQMEALLKRGAALIANIVDVADSHNNTLLSEAAAGGSAAVATMLLQRGADPNSQGEFLRTPLWRAAFLGMAEMVPLLLQAGADPRIGNEGNELPLHVAASPAIKQALQDWDVAATDRLVAAFQAKRDERLAGEQQQRAAALRGVEGDVDAAKVAADAAQNALRHARQELEKRIFEHDTCVEEKKSEELLSATLEAIKAAEAAVAAAKARAATATDALDVARLKLRDQQQAEAAAGGGGEDEEALVGLPVDIKDLDDVLVRDVGGKMASDGRWPLVVDPSSQASVFLRYMDTNYVNALSAAHTAPETLRRSLLGALRYGKPLVVDLQDCDLWDELGRIFDGVQPGLLTSLLDKSIIKADRFLAIVKPCDGEEYEPNKFQDVRTSRFKFVLLTSSHRPNEEMVAKCYALRVIVRGG